MCHRVLVPFLCGSALLVSVSPASAQFIGTFSWQTQPYCNVITLNVTQAGNAYILEGYDDLCGAERRAPVTGTAAFNPNGTVGLGLTIVNAPGGEPTHMDVAIDVGTLLGSWSDSAAIAGTFVFDGAGSGPARPTSRVAITAFNQGASLTGYRADGTPAAPTALGAGRSLFSLGARGHDGTSFSGSVGASVVIATVEAWTPTAHGTRIVLQTTQNGTTDPEERLRVDHNGRIGIGTTNPARLLDVDGDIRIGTGPLGCVEDGDGDVIAGVCSSDLRLKRDVVPFAPMLSKVAALRPVHFYWRADEFPARALGSQQSYGLVAQEVEEVLPDLVATGADGYKAVNYSKLPLLALQAIKELKAKNDALEAQNAEFERRLAELEARVKP